MLNKNMIIALTIFLMSTITISVFPVYAQDDGILLIIISKATPFSVSTFRPELNHLLSSRM